MSKGKTLLVTLALIALGAAMPWLAGRMQDAGMDRWQERLELNAVSLTLRKDAGAAPVLRMLTGECTAVPWGKETSRTEEEVCAAAMEVMGALNRAGLLSGEELERLERSGLWGEPDLLIGEDGASALVWSCYWEEEGGCYVRVDDNSGKAVQITARAPAYWENAETQIRAEEAGELTVAIGEDIAPEQLKRWISFLEEYYGIVSETVAEEERLSGSGISRSFRIEFDLQDGGELCPLSLRSFENTVAFNIW